MTHRLSSDTAAETLDPTDWEEARAVAHQMIDDMIDHVRTLRERPAWRTTPQSAKDALSEPAPKDGAPLAEVYEAFKAHILPYPTGNAHPAFWGWVMGNGTVTGMLADALASGMNAHVAGYDQAAAVVERQVIAWLAELVGYPPHASGLLVTGGTMANLNGLAVARSERAGFDVRERGLQAQGAPRLRVYGGDQTHGWIYKACELMGLGREAFRVIPTDDRYRIDIAACRDAIRADRANGETPFCLLGTVGTVNTGAIDDIAALRALADEFGLWLHVDGAFGSLAAWSEEARPLVAGQELADSLAFDLHKWGYMPYEAGCILTRDPKAQDRTFNQPAPYLSATRRGLAVDTTFFADRGVQLSRSFRALKVWFSMKEQGVDRIGRVIAQNIAQAQYLAQRLQARPHWEVLAPVSLNIVCFRRRAPGLSAEAVNALNEEALVRLQESGTAVPSHTWLDGVFAIRVCITNHRTQTQDLDRLVDDLERHASAILAEQEAAGAG